MSLTAAGPTLPVGSIALLLFSLGFAGCAADGTEDLSTPSIILISIDTLRSDHLPAYGYQGVETPGIDALRRDGVLFERAYSHSPTTLPSHSSMLTGLLPPEHGVRGNSGYRLDGEAMPYLPKLLAERGYATGAAVSSFVMRHETGLAIGFDFYEDRIGPQTGERLAEAAPADPDSIERRRAWRMAERERDFQRRGADTLAAGLPWLRAQAEQPFFFFFLHLYDTHSPHLPPEPFASRYALAYDGEIAVVDRVVSDLISELKAMGRYTDAMVILTSDHGEGLGDHGEDGHGIFLYRESLQVPMLLKLPGNRWAGKSVATPVQLVDLVPTVLELLGGKKEEGQPGTSLIQLIEAPPETRQIYSETYFPRFFFGWSELASLIEGSLQYIESPEPELYDLEADAAQQINLVRERIDATRRLRQELARRDRKMVKPRDTDIETWKKLASLGYVGHGRLWVEESLVAPQSQVHLLELMGQGFRSALDGDDLAAVETLERVVEENPFAVVTWEQLGRSLLRLGRLEESHQAYLKALELTDGAPHLLLAVARSSARLGDYDRARTLAIEARPWDEAGALQILGEVALAGGQVDEAEQHLQGSLATRPDNVDVLFMLAQVQLRRGSFEEALTTTGQIGDIAEEPYPKLGLLRGNILASAGRMDEAEQALKREIELFPQGTLAYSRLALFLARQGRPQEAVAVVRQLVETRGDAKGYAVAAQTLEALGDPHSARALLHEASRLFPDNMELADLRQATEN